MRPRARTIRLRWALVAVAVVALAMGAVVQGWATWQQRVRCLSAARHYRWFERMIRPIAERYDVCASKHPDAILASVSCVDCARGLAYRRALDGRRIRSAAEAADAMWQVVGLYSKTAERYERGAAAPWSDLPPMSPFDRAAWQLIGRGDGPLHETLLNAY